MARRQAADQAASAALAATLDKGDGQDAAAPSKTDAFADKLTALSQALSSPAQTARPVTAAVPGQPLNPQAGNFSEAVVDKVMWMSSQNLKTADIQMEPAQLGKLEVRIDMTRTRPRSPSPVPTPTCARRWTTAASVCGSSSPSRA